MRVLEVRKVEPTPRGFFPKGAVYVLTQGHIGSSGHEKSDHTDLAVYYDFDVNADPNTVAHHGGKLGYEGAKHIFGDWLQSERQYRR